MPDPGAGVTWDWPADGGTPFDTTADETRWLLVASSTFGRTWPAGDRRDFGSWTTDFEARVPMGYKTIQIVERLAVLDRGEVVREWPETPVERPAPVHDPYQHHVPGFGAGATYAVLDGLGGVRRPDGSWEKHEHDSRAAALAEARTIADRRVLVVRLGESMSWH